jgi:hypothetical protein
VSDAGQALGQRFPNPSPAAFRPRVALVDKRFGFRAFSLRFLRPRQLAPLLVVETDRDRKAFVGNVPAIMRELDPIRSAGRTTAATFERFLLEARDRRGAIVRAVASQTQTARSASWNQKKPAAPGPACVPTTAPSVSTSSTSACGRAFAT